MGVVWQATDTRLDVPAAVKLMNPVLVRTREARERFLREARAAARVTGSHVVAVHDSDVDALTGVPYLAMELLRGESLAARLRRGPLGYLQTRALLSDVVRALARAHRLGVVHRDLKPGNIFLATTDDGISAKILDFGIAKLALADPLTDPYQLLGTPHYMSPEQIEDAQAVDHRADLWSLSLIVYECLTGQQAFPGHAPIQVLHKIALERPALASSIAAVPRGFDAWFDRGIRRDRAERYQSAQELFAAFAGLDSDPVSFEPEPDPPRRRGRLWVSDAAQVDIESIEELVYRNAAVEEFMEDERRHFVSGAKGCGKTLLLTYKRARLGARYQREGRAAVTFIPEGRPYLDMMSDLRSVGRPMMELMAALPQAKRLWGFSLRLSIVSYVLGVRLPRGPVSALPPSLRPIADGQAAEPTLVLRELLSLGVGQIHQVLGQLELPLEHALRSVHEGVFVFVDKIDQALRGVSKDAWVAMQAGLVEAAWDLMGANPHVKVFATIREEAFSSYASDIKTNLFGATTRLRYTKTDLRKLLGRLTTFYEGLPLTDFVTLDVVTPGGASETESAFDFLVRHTLNRPRDLVIVASEISRLRGELDERGFKLVVEETCASILVANVFEEMRVFLEVLTDPESRSRFFSCLRWGALSRDDLIEAWCRFHGVERDFFDDYGQASGDVFHPFRELYDCGLLGVVVAGEHEDEARQRFRQPHDPTPAYRHDLPPSPVYLLHPTLQALVRQQGMQEGLQPMRELVIGHDHPFRPHHAVLIRVQRELLRSPCAGSGPVAAAVRELVAELARRASGGEDPGRIRAELGRTPAVAELSSRLESAGPGWDDLHLAVLEAFPSTPT